MVNKKIIILASIFLVLIIGLVIFLIFNENKDDNNNNSNNNNNEEVSMNIIELKVNDRVLKIKLEDNSSAIAFKEKLQEGDLIIEAHDYGNFEKVGDLGFRLPTNDTNITTEPGDVILYQGNQITLYYDTNTWNFTKIGRVQNITGEELKEILGAGDVTLVFSLPVENNKIAFDFSTKTVTLNSGYEMPLNGIGTYSLTGEVCYNAITSALNSGVRLIDTAYMYGNEEEIGRAIRDSGIKREEIFVITKIYPSQFANPEAAIEMALEKLDIGYIDMLLLHHPGDGDVEAYKAMEKYVETGKIRSLGLSNFYIEELEEFLPQIDIMPALVQNEIHPYYQENDVIPYIQNLGIVVQGWYPFGGRGHTNELLNDEVIVEIANNHNVSSAQVILRWNLQKGVVVIPGSSNPDHIKENTEIYHFELSDLEMEKINALDRNEKHDWY